MANRTILVVDDTTAILKHTKEVLELAGYDVVTATDGELALPILTERKVDLVVTDILMPNMDGYQLCYTIRTTGKIKDIPIIIYSAAFVSAHDVEMAMEIGADQFIRKPQLVDDLVDAANRLLAIDKSSPRTIPKKQKMQEATQLYNEGLVNKLERRNAELEAATKRIEQSDTKRKIAEQTLLESYERFELVSKATNDAIWDWDIKNNFTTWNQGLQTIFGYADRLTYDSLRWWKDKIHPDDFRRIWSEINECFDTECETWNSSYRYKTVDNIYRHVFDRALIVYKDREPVRMIGAMQDVDDRVKALEEIKRLSVVASKIENGVIILNRDACIEWVNESFTRMSGYTLPEVAGKKPYEFLHGPETGPIDMHRIMEQLKQLRPYTDEILNYAKDGRKYWVRLTVTPVLNDQGELDKFITIQSDITVQKEFEINLTAIAKERSRFIENANATIFSIDRNGYVSEWNKIVARVTGLDRDEVLGKKWIDFLEAQVKVSMMEVLNKVYTGESIDNYELPIINKIGNRVILSISISPQFDGHQQIIGAICVGQDLTEVFQYRQNLERMVEERTHDLNEALKKEKELVEMKNKFVSIASHEFRNPLATIRFAADSIRNYYNKLSTAEILKKLEKIQEQSSHMNDLLEDVLTIGKSDAKKINVVKSTINLKNFIETLIDEVKATHKVERQVVFTFKRKVPFVNMDDKLLRNIVINLLTNAIKFSRTDTTVSMNVMEIDDWISLEVIDHGIGIREDELDSVFESFQRGSNVEAVQGTGLGLSIVKKAVDLMGGSIKVESILNVGSSFKILLPYK